MNINFVDLARQNKLYNKELMGTIKKIVDTATFSFGEDLKKFETSFAAFCHKKYCVGLNSGTDALFFALIAYGIGKGDEVILPPNTYFACAMVISNLGARPVFVDIDPHTYTIDVTKIEEKITSRTKAIMPVHLYGQPADMDPIIAIAKKHSLVIIEDCCQAHGAEYKGKRVPVTGIGAFSFYPGKNLGAFGDAGALVTNSKQHAETVELLSNDGAIRKYEHVRLGYKSRLDTLQAAILQTKLEHLPTFTQKRREAASYYTKLLKNLKILKTPIEAPYAKHVYHIYLIEVENRDALQKHLAKKGIQTVIHYPTPIHLQKPYREQGYKEGDYPITEKKAKRILSLPLFPEIKKEEMDFIVGQIKKFYL